MIDGKKMMDQFAASDERLQQLAAHCKELRAERDRLRDFLECGGIDSSAVLAGEEDRTWTDDNERLKAQLATVMAERDKARERWENAEDANIKLCNEMAERGRMLREARKDTEIDHGIVRKLHADNKRLREAICSHQCEQNPDIVFEDDDTAIDEFCARWGERDEDIMMKIETTVSKQEKQMTDDDHEYPIVKGAKEQDNRGDE